MVHEASREAKTTCRDLHKLNRTECNQADKLSHRLHYMEAKSNDEASIVQAHVTVFAVVAESS